MKYRTSNEVLNLTVRQFAARVIGRYRMARQVLKMNRRDAIRFALPA
jgi:hypothetical protein